MHRFRWLLAFVVVGGACGGTKGPSADDRKRAAADQAAALKDSPSTGEVFTRGADDTTLVIKDLVVNNTGMCSEGMLLAFAKQGPLQDTRNLDGRRLLELGFKRIECEGGDKVIGLDLPITTTKAAELGVAKPKPPEAVGELATLAKAAKAAFLAKGAFPTGKVGPTPPTACCKGASYKCAVTDAWSKEPIWQALGFHVDEPGAFQYAYESDGATFTATAVGDLDCDDVMITYTMRGAGGGGEVKMDLQEPPPNTD